MLTEIGLEMERWAGKSSGQPGFRTELCPLCAASITSGKA